MMADGVAELLAAARAKVPGLGSGEAERLGGLTNLVFRIGDHCLRLPGKGTEEYIDRANEAVAAREGWNPGRIGDKATGKRAGWWGMGAASGRN